MPAFTPIKRLIVAAAAIALFATPALAARTADEPKSPPGGYSFNGPFGQHDQRQLQRGFKVWREVCSSCHAMHLVHFRDLGEKGGPFWNPKYKSTDNPVVKALAAQYQISDLDTTTGDPIKRPGTPADAFPSPYPNATAAAAANGGAAPPDHSTIVKARDGGAEYIYSLIAFGYGKAVPAGLKVGPGQNYNPYYPGDLGSYYTGKGKVPTGGFIAMPQPLKAGQVTFDDGTKSTLPQESADVAAFLDWASDPHADERKEMGTGAVFFMLILAGLTFLSYKRIWRNVAH
ncbi:MAG TPA: cytochrome c1 [Caulobacteraceae bacterium]|nr:cytochrome c1 [Caulobacteraceae bacterium]